jgi:hypothetical protein
MTCHTMATDTFGAGIRKFPLHLATFTFSCFRLNRNNGVIWRFIENSFHSYFGMLWNLICGLALAASMVYSQPVPSQNFWPSMVPLAVRSPYLNAWMSTPNGTTPLNSWPILWNGIVVISSFSCTIFTTESIQLLRITAR